MKRIKTHSPGPWAELGISWKRALVIDANGGTVARIEGQNGASDAHLIAAAPELLGLLVDLVSLSEGTLEGLKYQAEDQSEEAQEEVLDALEKIMASAKEAIKKAQP